MTKIKSDNPFAFPLRKDVVVNQGMTLRDYFAAKAMQAELSTYEPSSHVNDEWFNGRAKFSYKMADAMLKARNDSSAD